MSRPGRLQGDSSGEHAIAPAMGDGPNVRAIPRIWMPLLLVAAGAWVYAGSLSGPFIFDDLASIPDNPHVRHLWPIWKAMRAPADTTVAGRPIVSLSLAINYALGGLKVQGYHATNLAFHLASSLLLFGVLRRTMQIPALAGSLGSSVPWIAFVIALIWTVHPLQTDSVTYIVQRTELLMGFFYLLTLYCALRSWGPSWRRSWFTAAVLACCAGMGSKEVMASAPLMVLLYDWTFVSGTCAGVWRRRRALYLALALTWLILVALVASQPRAGTVGFGLGLSAIDYLRTQAGVIVWYLRLCVWPDPLVIHYEWPVPTTVFEWLAPGTFVLALLALTVWGLRCRVWWGFVGTWFFLILAPTSSLLPIVTEPAAERRMYLPLAAVLTLCVLGSWWVLRGALKRFSRRFPVAKWAACGLTIVVASSLGYMTAQRNKDYRSALAIWSDAAAVRPRNVAAQSILAHMLYELGRIDEAVTYYRKVLELRPDHAETHYNIANALVELERFDEAFEHFNKAVRFKPDYAEAHNNFGRALAMCGRIDDAMFHFAQSLKIKPNYVEAHINIGNAFAGLGKTEMTVAHLLEALRIEPSSVVARMSLAGTFLDRGDFERAATEYRHVLDRDPENADAHCNLGITLAVQKRTEEAIGSLREALRLQPGHQSAKHVLDQLTTAAPGPHPE